MLKLTLVILLACLLLAAALLSALAIRDGRAADRLAQTLREGRDPAPPLFDPAMVEGLPEVAQRYLLRAIAPGTPLSRTVDLSMEGVFLLNGSALPMRATQVLHAPEAFVWQSAFGSGALRLRGSDALAGAESWTRFGLFGLLPVARAGGNADHRRSAATRALMESVWAPAALLPLFGAHWEATGPDSARVSIPGLAVAPMELTLAPDGTILSLTAPRWSDANPDRSYRLQSFGGRILESRRFGGFTIPARVELGNHWGTPDFDGFFRATITAARW